MICPRCKQDNNSYFRGDDHSHMELRRYGRLCHSCHFVFEVIARPTGDSYFKRIDSELTPDMFAEHVAKRADSAQSVSERRRQVLEKRHE